MPTNHSFEWLDRATGRALFRYLSHVGDTPTSKKVVRLKKVNAGEGLFPLRDLRSRFVN